MPRFTLLYLHGFLSSPSSEKAQLTLEFASGLPTVSEVLIPSLKAGPAATIVELQELLRAHDPASLGVIGSSLGGFYATVLAEQLQIPAVLINPAVSPAQYWRDYIGEHRNYHTDEIHEVTHGHVQELRELDPFAIQAPEKYRVYLQRHDEVLDYRQALDKYGTEQCLVREDGDHSYADFERELPDALEFLLNSVAHN